MTEERLQEIRARCAAATPGKWFEINLRGYISTSDHPSNNSIGHCGRQEDARFAAHARQDVPDLLDEVERLRALYRNLSIFVIDWHLSGNLTEGFASKLLGVDRLEFRDMVMVRRGDE